MAHRAASGYLPEHTLPAVALAHSWNVDFIEPDIVLTKDNVPVVLHDIHLDTTTNVSKVFPKKKRKDGRYYAIDFSLKEIKKLRVHERIDLLTGKKVFSHRFPLNNINFQVPTFEEYIQLVQGLNQTRHKQIGLIPEIKSPIFHQKNGKDITKVVFQVLKKYNLDKRRSDFYLQCFDPKELKRIRYQLKYDLNLVQLLGDNSWKEADCDYDQLSTPQGLKNISQYADIVSPWMNPLIQNQNLKAFVQTAHKVGLKVVLYTLRIDDLPTSDSAKEIFNEIQEAGVDGLFTDFADLSFL